MAGRGPTPSQQRARSRNAKRAEEAVTEIDAGAAPARARPLPGAKSRHPSTRRWWRRAATSPQASLFMETDWLVLERLADLYDAWFGGNLSVGSEIRLCEAKLGFTPEDRLRLRWRLSAAKGDEGESLDESADVSSGPPEDPRLRLVPKAGSK